MGTFKNAAKGLAWLPLYLHKISHHPVKEFLFYNFSAYCGITQHIAGSFSRIRTSSHQAIGRTRLGKQVIRN